MNQDFIAKQQSSFINTILSLRGKEKGKEWLDKLPEIIKEYENKWGLKSLGVFSDLSINYVEKVKTIEGRNAVLKVGFPGDEVFLDEIKTLQVYKGNGAVKIINLDLENFVVLLERCMPGDPLHILNDEVEEIKIFSEVCEKIWKKGSDLAEFNKLEEESRYFDWYFENLEKCKDSLPEDLVIKAREKFEYLIKTSGKQYLLHADLHHDNILKSEREWLCIDPKGIIGEREYEPSVYILNPYKRFKEDEKLINKDFFAKRINLISKELELDPKRLAAWAFIKQILALIWSLQDYGIRDKISIRNARELEKLL